MKPTVLVTILSSTILVLIPVMLYGSQALSRELPKSIPSYTPIGTASAGKNDMFPTAWLLDTANQRVVMCYQDMERKENSSPICKYTDLPKN